MLKPRPAWPMLQLLRDEVYDLRLFESAGAVFVPGLLAIMPIARFRAHE